MHLLHHLRQPNELGNKHAVNASHAIIIIKSISIKFIPPQQCVGAVGPQCGLLRQNRDGTFRGIVSVGSILHDNCCIINYPNGFMCDNGGVDQEVCKPEMEKAFLNWDQRKQWRVKRGWGPYDEGEGDDITLLPARISLPKAEHETAKTLEFAAPPNTKLDMSDEDFCESREFRKTVPKKGYGICR